MKSKFKILFYTLLFLLSVSPGYTQEFRPASYSMHMDSILFWLIFILFVIILCGALLLKERVKDSTTHLLKEDSDHEEKPLESHLHRLNLEQITRLLKIKKKGTTLLLFIFGISYFSSTTPLMGQTAASTVNRSNLLEQAGILITIFLILIPILLGIILLIIKTKKRLKTLAKFQDNVAAEKLSTFLEDIPLEKIAPQLEERKKALSYQVAQRTLSGTAQAADERGLLQPYESVGVPIVSAKKKAVPRPNIDPQLSKLILWYLVSATIWLLFGTTVGEYIGIKFIAPDLDSVSWLSFGRLRPVHTNSVFWGWASIAMIGLSYYVVPRVSNTTIYNLKWGWITLILLNTCALAGSISLMAGINNGGGEYREYIWPIMLLFAIALVLTCLNFYKTIAMRTTREVYISNWYILSAVIFTIVIALVAYIPFWQQGLGETIVQGYYMHQGVGMWFMLLTLGLVYYFLPQQLNKPIYSYSLGVLAFWTQILFYTLIGSHHFVFSAIPWWLQTVAIVGSAGMVIPVVAGTTNFLMTFKGSWYKVGDSYTLPFFLVGIIFYFSGSLQGTAEAFRNTNLLWHFTDFTVAHSHLTMYGIICFLLWACIYAVVPRLTGKEAPQVTVGAHFWLALIGLLFYTIPLMYGSTLKGLLWMDGKPFIEGVAFMMPHWLWRAVGGSLMWISHLFFAYNMYRMLVYPKTSDIRQQAIDKLEANLHTIEHTK
ncbi:cbb3-type cytochrome c oxidase subunit I [Sphingobacterium faecium]|uniref:cbb3-type cytochrome c oxidase subunit I n=1 Tax=Sphingobacterium faecium TaxID=34087 RepID=UPI0024696E19|nr:cbb3-type cytochrome c oxidase subunit I [Sphingobacterium faecium]MDH5828787.1 cbb3-type cytochrome c oxidase subunit I [Sphingobacterium faecium]